MSNDWRLKPISLLRVVVVNLVLLITASYKLLVDKELPKVVADMTGHEDVVNSQVLSLCFGRCCDSGTGIRVPS